MIIHKKLKNYILTSIRDIKRSKQKGLLRQYFHFIFKNKYFSSNKIKKYLRNEKIKKLQVGGGFHLKKNWLNGDIIAGELYLNAAKEFPLPESSFNYIFAEQFIEHLTFHDGFIFLKECHKILMKDGKIRLSTPDLKKLSNMYLDKNTEVSIDTALNRHKKNHNGKVTTPCHFINDMFRLWGHKFIYDENTLLLQLKNAGFTKIRRYNFGGSDTNDLTGLERHADVEWMKNGFQLIIEAQK